MSTRFDPEGRRPPRTGLLLLQGFTWGLFCLFALRLWYLQIHKGEEFALKAQENQLRREAVYAPRGLIRDRNGELVAVNQPAYVLGLVREDCKDPTAILDKVSEWTGADREELRERFHKGKRLVKPFEPLILVPDLSFELLARIEANALFWPGLKIVVRPRRYYPQGELLAHVLGYVAEANEEEMEKDEDLSLGDDVGKGGLELVFESRLRGTKGLRQSEVDATGRRLNQKTLRTPAAGENIHLSIDLKLQEHCAGLLEGKAGAIVVMEPHTGQVLAFVSQPSFDNNVFTTGLSTGQWEALRDDPMHPLQNRVVQSVYPPGSVFKLIVASCGLSEELLDPEETEYCPGFWKLGRRVFKCWKKHGHGRVALNEAIVQSCDVYFYHLGDKLKVDRISPFAKACGFGRPTGIDLPHEKPGLIPSKEWKLKRFGEPWQGGENLNLAIGQGYVQVSPIQVARFIAALVNGGDLLKPELIKSDSPARQGELPLSDEDRQMIVDAMVDTVNEGTARRLRRKDARIGGKTGTAQVVKLMEELDEKETEEIPYKFRDHAWLASFGEKDGKAYVAVCMVEHGGHGSEAAGPVLKGVYRYLFGKRK
ncbi:MAG: penicillin-binding protein 2 [Thermodesulfobacteriota bacterium]|nr:penicillin-binding protein 2 [Thermodesulfobacteriota bacterium]